MMSVVASRFCPARRNSDEMLLGPVFFTTTRKPAVLPALTPSLDRFVESIAQPFGGAARAPSGAISAAASEATANAAVRRLACVRFKGVLQANGSSSRGGACTIDDPNRYSSLTDYRSAPERARVGESSPSSCGSRTPRRRCDRAPPDQRRRGGRQVLRVPTMVAPSTAG